MSVVRETVISGAERAAELPRPTLGHRREELAEELTRQEDRLLACIHCGFCLPACPTYTRLGDEGDSPRGRLLLMRAVAEGRMEASSPAFHLHIGRCLGCRACESVCPAGVEYGLLLERARHEAAHARRTSPMVRLLLWMFAREGPRENFMALSRWMRASGLPALLARWLPARGPFLPLRTALGMLASTAPSRAVHGRRARRRIRPAAGAPEAALLAGRSRRARGRTHPSEEGGALHSLDATGQRPVGASEEGGGEMSGAPLPEGPAVTSGRDGLARHVGVLEGCVQAGLFAHVNQATVRVLTANGFAVHAVHGQGCCGALHAHGGDLEGARTLARRNIDAFEAAGVEWVVVNAAGCGAVMKEYGELLSGDPAYRDRAHAFSQKVREVSEALGERGPLRGAPLEMSVTYDAPCHLIHAQRIAQPPLDLLGAIPNLDLRPLRSSAECCGGAGIYGLVHPRLGGRIGSDKADAVLETGAGAVATGNPGCIMQIGAALRAKGADVAVVHPVELLDQSYRRAGRYP